MVSSTQRISARIADGETGYYVPRQREDACLQAAIATVTQTPIREVPDLRLQARLLAGDDPERIAATSWRIIARWAERRGLRLVFHEKVPVPRRRWIGICPSPLRDLDLSSDVRAGPAGGLISYRHSIASAMENPFRDHALILSHGRVIFDPAASADAPPGMKVHTWKASEVVYGISFDPPPNEGAKHA